ncbi:hypothetical protein O3M35_008875 [Rhynocoris fuscipes]|uniref:Centrosome-associated zinc finger protein CP190 n=1 Tax=Rhynocoris fuscipes TaxID=488301 RepID=A0AAW1DA67_9HEMI
MMAADSKQNLKQLRVDNWAVFFLQRLQLLFAKGDQCDLTLKFVTGQELKVHRLVLSTSTSFFESLECKGNVIQLPESLPYNVVQPIINFLYSGRLEFKAELYAELLAIAKIMKLAILARILIAQKNENGIGDKSSGKLLDVKKFQNKTTPVKTPTANQASYVNILAGKKLPIWKKRTVPYKIERKPMKIEEPKPTRFEWPDEQSCNNFMMASPSFTSLSYESAPVISPPAPPPSSSPVPHTSTPLKRRVVPPINDIPDKIFKADGNATVLLTTDERKPEDGTSVTNVSDDDDDDDGHFETIHTYGDSDDDFDTPMETDTPVSSSLKPILKPMTETPLTTPSKKVRFSFTPEDKENKIVKATDNVETPPAKSVEKITDISKKTEKIIQEVLKKYPDLVKNNKNIKLKITAPGSPQQNTIMIDTKKRIVPGKSSYIVLKPAGKTDPLNSSSNEDSEKQTKTSTSNTADTSKGPWKCESCVSGKNPLKFESFVEFRKHMQEKHLEKVDSRACEFCGYKATKRNLHLYHLYTKHGVDPPKNVKFPKCSQCSYIALSESLLIKHLNTHQQAKDLTCLVCNTTFRTHSSLHLHSLSCKPNIGARSYPCQNCDKIFKTNVSLNAHTKVCSSNKVDEDEGGGGGDSVDGGGGGGSAETTDNVIEVPIIETVDMDKGEHALVQIPSGIILTENPNVALIPTSESETLNNVASDITTSIGLTVAIPQDHQQAVILLDGNSQFFLQSNESVVVSNESDVEEYIVPELLRDEMGQIYTTQNVPYTVTSTGVIACPVLPIQQNKNEVSKDKGKDNRTVSDRNKTFSDGELMDTSEDNNRESFLDSAETHLESSNTRVEIKDSQDHQSEILDDVVQLQKVLQSPEPSESIEEIHLNVNDNSEMEVEKSQSNIVKSFTSDNEVEKLTGELNIEQQNQDETNVEQQKRQDTNLEEQNQEESNVGEQNKEESNVEEPKQHETKELNKEESSKEVVNDEESVVQEVNHAESKEDESNHEELNEVEVKEEETNIEESIQEKLNVEEKGQNELNVEELNHNELNVEQNEEESNVEEPNEEESNMEELNEEESNMVELNQEELNVEEVNQDESNEEELNQEKSNDDEPLEEELKETNSDVNEEQHVEIDERNERDKAISLVRDWGFDNEEDTDDDSEDPDSRPSRPTMDF